MEEIAQSRRARRTLEKEERDRRRLRQLVGGVAPHGVLMSEDVEPESAIYGDRASAGLRNSRSADSHELARRDFAETNNSTNYKLQRNVFATNEQEDRDADHIMQNKLRVSNLNVSRQTTASFDLDAYRPSYLSVPDAHASTCPITGREMRPYSMRSSTAAVTSNRPMHPSLNLVPPSKTHTFIRSGSDLYVS
jgi:hypothetical protein